MFQYSQTSVESSYVAPEISYSAFAYDFVDRRIDQARSRAKKMLDTFHFSAIL